VDEYDNQLFPGEIQTVVGEKYEVSAMIKAGRYCERIESTHFGAL
jgi:hypothetical protein